MGIRTSFSPMGTFGKKLPPGYIELEYLESTGTQWIDTGIKPSQFDEFEIEFCVLKEVRNCGNYFGIDDNVEPNAISHAVTAYTAGHSTFWFACGNAETSFASIYSPKMKAKYRLSENKAEITTDNGSLTCSKAGEYVDVSMYLFRANGAAARTTYKDTGLRIYYSRMKRSGGKVQHLVPALDPTGRPCMFDLVTRRPFYNQGTGEFLYE